MALVGARKIFARVEKSCECSRKFLVAFCWASIEGQHGPFRSVSH